MANKKRKKQPAADVDMNVDSDPDMEDVNLNEVTDSEEEYTESERLLLHKVRTRRSSENYESEEEIYKLKDDDEMDEDEEDSMESDIEGLQEEFDLPNQRAWGKKKRDYYSTDYVDPDYASASQKDLAEAQIEEQEARSIQKKLAEQLDDIDFGLEFVQPQEEKDEIEEGKQAEIVKTDLTKLSKRQKQTIMQKESPEFAALVNDFKDRMTEATDVLAPYLNLVESRIIPDCHATSFVKTKYYLSLNYCVNISFYLMLKAKRLPVNSHPVIKRLAQYRQLLNQLESGQGDLINDIKEILNVEKEGKPLYRVSDGTELTSRPKQMGKSLGEKLTKRKNKTVDRVEKKMRSFEDEFVNLKQEESTEEEKEDEENISKNDDAVMEGTEYSTKETEIAQIEGKRAITYEMAKNKGLTPHRKKEQRNPRVKHRNKYRKAKIRRKGAVREVRKEETRYSGEVSGIKASVKKSIKLK